ncbi:hypothetical protein MCETHM1_00560 [Flavobacteriaceae bacterium]
MQKFAKKNKNITIIVVFVGFNSTFIKKLYFLYLIKNIITYKSIT